LFLTKPFHTVELSDPKYEHEGLRLATVKSRALGRRADISLWVPDTRHIGTLLILLHGVHGSHWVWSQKAGVHRIAQAMLSGDEIVPMVIAMPSDGLARDGSGYLTHPGAEDAERWIVEEVPALAELVAPTLHCGVNVAIAGLSMGGYGALRLGAKYAERFSAISAHSSITEPNEMKNFVEEPLSDYLGCAPHEELTPLYWMRRRAGDLPKLRFDCGVDDPLITGNRTLHSALNAEGIAHDYAEYAGGHDWHYWQQHVEKTLRFVGSR
jgi:enterochelin esterase-like enzyme